MPFKIGSDRILNGEKAQSVVFIVCSFQKGSLPILYQKKLHIHNADGLASDKRDLVLVLSQKQFVLFKFFSLQRFVLSRRSSTITEELRREAWQTHLGWLDRRTKRTKKRPGFGLKKVWNSPRFWPFWGWEVVWKLWTQWDIKLVMSSFPRVYDVRKDQPLIQWFSC